MYTPKTETQEKPVQFKRVSHATTREQQQATVGAHLPACAHASCHMCTQWNRGMTGSLAWELPPPECIRSNGKIRSCGQLSYYRLGSHGVRHLVRGVLRKPGVQMRSAAKPHYWPSPWKSKRVCVALCWLALAAGVLMGLLPHHLCMWSH